MIMIYIHVLCFVDIRIMLLIFFSNKHLCQWGICTNHVHIVCHRHTVVLVFDIKIDQNNVMLLYLIILVGFRYVWKCIHNGWTLDSRVHWWEWHVWWTAIWIWVCAQYCLKIPGFFKPQYFNFLYGKFNFDKHSDTLFMKLNKWRNIWIFLLEIHF